MKVTSLTLIALGQALEWSDKALTERRESEVYQEELNAGVDYALVSFLPSFLGTQSISYRGNEAKPVAGNHW